MYHLYLTAANVKILKKKENYLVLTHIAQPPESDC